MLVLTFQVDQVPYAVPVKQVIEVVPRVPLRQIPHAPACFLGLLRYRGSALPVIDLGLLLGRAACRDRLDSRVLVVRTTGDAQLMGLLAEQVNDLVEVDASRMAMQSPLIVHAPYLTAVYETETGLLQLIDPGRIEVRSVADSARMALP